MNKIILVGVFIVTCLVNYSSYAQVGGCDGGEEAAIRKVLNEFNDAWTARSASRYGASFAEDADWENAFGGHKKGRAAIEQTIGGLTKQFNSAEETITNTKIWCMSHKTALVDIYQTISGQKLPKSGNIVPTRHIRMTQIYEKIRGKWQIRVHRVTDLREAGANRPTKDPTF